MSSGSRSVRPPSLRTPAANPVVEFPMEHSKGLGLRRGCNTQDELHKQVADEFYNYVCRIIRDTLCNTRSIFLTIVDSWNEETLKGASKVYSGFCFCIHGVVRGKVADYRYCIEILDFKNRTMRIFKMEPRNPKAWPRNFFTWEQLRVFTEYDIWSVMRTVKVLDIKGNTSIVQAAPGCGKSHSIITKLPIPKMQHTDWIVLTSTAEGKEDMRGRAIEVGVPIRRAEDFIMTIDSYIMHDRTNCRVLMIDEALMQHPGKVLYAMHFAQPDVTRLYGDVKQIPFICRLPDFICIHPEVSKIFPVSEMLNVSYRSPADVCFLLNEEYAPLASKLGLQFGMKCKSTILRSMKIHRISGLNHVPKRDDLKYLTFKQSEAQTLRSMGYKDVSTVHEFQGKQADHVALVRESVIASETLYNSEEHYVTAISRHKKSLTYYTRLQPVHEDLVTRKINKAIRATDIVLRSFIHEEEPLITGGALVKERVVTDVRIMETTMVGVSKNVDLSNKSKDHYYVMQGRTYGRPFIRRKIDGANAVIVNGSESTNITQLGRFLDLFRPSGSLTYVGDLFMNVENKNIVAESVRRGASRVFFCGSNRDFMDKVVHDFASINALPFFGNQRVKVEREFVELPVEPCGVHIVDPIGMVQLMIDNFIPTPDNYYDQELDELRFNITDYKVDVGKILINPLTDVYIQPAFVGLRPVIKSTCYPPQRLSLKTALNALEKRNANVPKLTSIFDEDAELVDMCRRFKKMVPGLNREPIIPNAVDLQSWIDGQGTNVKTQMKNEVAIWPLYRLERYQFSIKPSPKPMLTVDALAEFPRPQTIIYQDKDMNALFCQIWNPIRDRVIASLDPKLLIYTCMSDVEFSDVLTSRFRPSQLKHLKSVEIDMKKYDKSQGRLTLLFECWVLAYFGVPMQYVEMWYQCHVLTTCRARDNMLIYNLVFQRKSGDAATFIGNTLALMIYLTAVVPLDKIYCGLFAGDDSVLFLRSEDIPRNLLILEYKFNLEAKVWMYEYIYFCSKYLIDIDDRWYLIPDPLKRAVKLGRRDLKNWLYAEEYRISFSDNVAQYGLPKVASTVALAMAERHSIYNFDATNCIFALLRICEREVFNELYYSNEGDVLNLAATPGEIEL